MELYNIVRMYENADRRKRVVRRGVTLEEARKWCRDPETSSMTASKPRGCAGDETQIKRWHELEKHWFDGFERI